MSYGARKRPKDGVHKAIPGDTISSIAASYGFTKWEEKVWNAGENAKLKEERVNPNTLMPADEVFVPELEKKMESRPVDAWHEFHVVRNKRYLRLKLHNADDTPIKNKPYTIEPDRTFRGTFVQQNKTTDGEGMIQEEIPHMMVEATLTLPEDNLIVKLRIGHIQPLPATEPVKNAGGDVAGALEGALSGGVGALGDIAKGAGGDLMGAAKGAGASLGGGLSGGLSGGTSGGGGASFDAKGAAGAVGGLGGQASGIAKAAAKNAMASAGAMIGGAAKAVAGALGLGSLGSNEPDPNIFPAAQRLHSMGFKPGEPKDNKRTAQFSGALMEFQTWCKKQGQLADGAGGPLGSLTSPGGVLGGGGGPLGEIAGAVAGPLLASVGLTGQLDEETIAALKKSHGC